MNNTLLRKQEQMAAKRYKVRHGLWDKRESALKTGDISGVESSERLLSRAMIAQNREMLAKVGAGKVTREDYESLIGANELLPSGFLSLGHEKRRTVGRIVIRLGGSTAYGTGFLIAPNLIMTNHHVLESASTAARAVIQFDYADDIPEQEGVSHALRPDLFFVAQEGLDFAVCGVESSGENGRTLVERGWNKLIAESGKAIFGESLYIIQHPGGRPQEVSLSGNRFMDVFDDFVYYENDTEPGSSGSPVFNRDWQLTSLHHAGVPSRLTAGRPHANEGIRISSIVTALQEAVRSSPQNIKAMLSRAFDDPPKEAGGRSPQNVPLCGTSPVVEMDADGSLHCQLPLRLSIGWNLPGMVRNALGADRAMQPVPAAPVVTMPAIIPAKDAIRRRAEELFEKFEDRPYLDSNDKEAAKDYYNGVSLGASKAKNYENLASLVAKTHSSTPSYNKARLEHLYPWVDLHEDGQERFLCSIYSGERVDAVDAIEEDLRLEAAMIGSEYLRLSRDKIVERLDTLETTAAFNCEHVVPQSWFGKKEPMRGDMHHLFACESDCNSFRSNFCYWQFTEEKFREKCGTLDTKNNRFEPVSGKGEVARATLYFFLRYPGLINDSAKEMQKERIEILRHWHADFAPSDYERHRNAAIFEIQGNRNPLIDHPDFAEKIDFAKGLG